MRDHRDILKYKIELQFKGMQKELLDIAELLIPSDKWSSFRRKVLDITNNSRRKLEKNIDDNYEITYNPKEVNEVLVEIKNKRHGKNDK